MLNKKVIYNAFQTKMSGSNLGKFRTVLGFVAEKILANCKEKSKCSDEFMRKNTSNFAIPSKCSILCSPP